jgi:hypothetical protein
VQYGQRGAATLAPRQTMARDSRHANADVPYPIETSAKPSRYVFLPAVIGLLLMMVDVPGLSLQDQANLMWPFLIMPLLTLFPLWRWTTSEAIDLTEHEIVVTRRDGSSEEVTRIPLKGVSGARGIGKPYRRLVPFWTYRQGACVAVRRGKDEQWFGLSMTAADATALAREIVRRAYRMQGGAVKEVEPEGGAAK